MNKFTFYFLCLLMPFIVNAQWEQLGQTIYGANSQDLNGSSVAISANGDIMAVSTPNDPTFAFYGGKITIYKLTDGQWVQLGSPLYGQVIVSQIGNNLSLSKDGLTLAYNELLYNKVHLFRFNGTEWVRLGQEVTINAANNVFGQVVRLNENGNFVLITDPMNDGEAFDSPYSNNFGRVSVFGFNEESNQWSQVGQNLYGQEIQETFGISADINGDGTVITAGSTRQFGVVRTYSLIDNQWEEKGQFLIGENTNTTFGVNVSLNNAGDILSVGISGYDDTLNNIGATKIYKFENGVWNNAAQFYGVNANDYCGVRNSLNAAGNILAVNCSGTNSNAGSIKIYKEVDGTWTQVANTLTGTNAQDSFGASISLNYDGTTLAVGIPNDDTITNNSGSTKVYLNCELFEAELDFVSDEICSGESTTLTATTTAGDIYWYDSENATESFFTGNEFTTPTLSQTTSYWIEAATKVGCKTERLEIVVNVTPTPVLEIVNPTVNVCEGSAVVLVASSVYGVINWYDSEDGAEPIFTGTEFETPEITSDVTYWVEAINGSCLSERLEVQVTMLLAPILEAETTYAICSGNPASLYASSPSNVIFWYANEDDTEYLYHGNLFVTEVLTENTTYWVEAYNLATGCRSERIEVTITVGEALSAPIAESTQLFVAGMTLADFEVEHTAPLTWYADAQLTQELPETTLVVAGTVYYVTQSGIGCESAATQVMADTFLGNGNLNSDKFAYYPNPVKDVLNFKGNEVVKSVQIYDLSGKLILNQNSNSIVSINLNSLPKGTYIAKVITGEGSKSFKFLKK